MRKLLTFRLDNVGDVHLPKGCELLSVEYLGNNELTACVLSDGNAELEKRSFTAIEVGGIAKEELVFVNMATPTGAIFGDGGIVVAVFEIPPSDPHWEYRGSFGLGGREAE